MRRVRRVATVLVICVFAALSASSSAWADGAAADTDLSIAQSLGDRELTVIVRRAEPVPGPLRVEVVTHSGTAPGTLALAAMPSDRAGSGSSGTVELGRRAGPYPATLSVDHAGPWELTVDDGEHTARIPFLVAARIVTPWERAAYGGFFTAGALLLISVGTALVARRGLLTLLPAGAMVAALAVGITGATLSAGAPPPRPAGSLLDPTSDTADDPYPERALPTGTNYSRPPANLTLRTPQGAQPGHSTELILSTTDSATGRPVDDLLVADDALMHLMIVGPTGQLWHRHPIRTAPGEFRVRLALPDSGDYAVAAEISRRGGGVALLRSTLRVPGVAGAATATEPRPDGTSLVTTPLVAGVPGTVTARFGGPADLQLWLGMLGHLIAVGPLPESTPAGTAAAAAPIWAHAHAMAPMPAPGTQPPDETVAAYGPDVSFTYTFPLPGRYLVWAQAERGYAVHTVPSVVDVKAGASQ